MVSAKTRIRRSVALAVALGAVVSSGASARVPDTRLVFTPSPAASHDAERSAAAPTMADTAARREARADAAWRAANPPRIIEVTSADEGGFDLASAGIGAAIPLTLILIEIGGRWVLRRRRDPARARFA